MKTNLKPDRKDRRGQKSGVLIVSCVVCAGVLILFFARASHSKDAPLVLPVAVVKALRTDLAQSMDFDAEFRPYQEVDLHAKVAGFVKEMKVDIGDHVEAGQLLATLEVPELADEIVRAQAMEQRSEDEVRQAQAVNNEAHLDYTRLVGVNSARPNLIAQQDLDNAQAKDQEAAAALSKAQQDVLVAKADAEKLKAILAYTRIIAPFAGTITKREADPGALIPGGTANSQTMPLLRLSQNDRLRLTFPVSVSYVSRIKVGEPVQIHVQSLGKDLTGNISRFTEKVETNTRTMDVEIDVPNPNLALVPGMYASVSLELERHENVLAVPVVAVSRKEIATCYVVNPQNEIQERIVTLGLETPTLIEILSGVKENELVMVGSRTRVEPGQKVVPKIVDVAVKEP